MFYIISNCTMLKNILHGQRLKNILHERRLKNILHERRIIISMCLRCFIFLFILNNNTFSRRKKLFLYIVYVFKGGGLFYVPHAFRSRIGKRSSNHQIKDYILANVLFHSRLLGKVENFPRSFYYYY